MNHVIDVNVTVGELVKERPERSRIFERLNIDYCCGGKVPLAQACAKHGLDLQAVLQQIQEADSADAAVASQLVDADKMSLSDLADHIERTHHAYLRSELPRLDQITHKVASVHGEKDARLAHIRRTFVALRDEMMSHMMKEEEILFPLVRQLEQANAPVFSHCGSIANPIHQMEHEHDQAGGALALMNVASDGYTPPEWACNTYRAMLAGLEKLEKDMHQHVHKENNVLFPKAIELESQLAGKGNA